MSFPVNSFNYSFGSGFPGFGGFGAPAPSYYTHTQPEPQPQSGQSQFNLNSIPQSLKPGPDYYGNQAEEEYPQNTPVQQPPRRRRLKAGRTARNYFQTPAGTILENEHPEDFRVAPIMGPIFVRDGQVPVVPLFSYPTVNNGTLLQIPILWTALSYALGLEVRGEVLRGLPCIKRLNQLFCPTAGQTYPTKRIEAFIDENKALIRRMYGEFMMEQEGVRNTPIIVNNLRRSTREVYAEDLEGFLGDGMARSNAFHFQGQTTENNRTRRQTVNPKNGPPTQQPKSNRVDSCESTTDITTPYWAANSSGKVRAIVNTKHFEQAIHQEVCTKTTTKRCGGGECGCEQKYKWHRLLAYDPDNDCKGVFMDWFLFPSCCVCRCNK